ncbi:putative flavin-binding monooxygenase [Botryosphaeria dothidea]|uniref:Flavin-binding monooxygenase n=1 Tax=Botryosphaeria dothidea TaxID=55169 RepID=A0A8H4N6Q7_9PEZI|nr:putative flavin-binding monooxygenase [Botryosphaeria dothidea]
MLSTPSEPKKDIVIIGKFLFRLVALLVKPVAWLRTGLLRTVLHPLSFKAHSELAEKHDGEKLWGYRRVFCAEVNLQAQKERESNLTAGATDSGHGYPPALDWIQPASIQSYAEIGTPQNSAQVHPYLFTTTIFRLALEAGARLIQGSAAAIDYSDNRKAIASVAYTPKGSATTTTIAATDVLIAAGPWTPKIFPRAQLLTPRGHSTVVKPTASISPYILFPNIASPPEDSSSWPFVSPELYPRPADSLFDADTIYSASGDDYEAPLPRGTADVVVDERRCTDVWKVLRSVVGPQVSGGEIITQQACYKPQIRQHEDGEEVGPIVGAVPGVKGLWLATGHDGWGISNAAGTGVVVSEMVFEGRARSADCEALDPRHFLKGEDE